MVLRRSTRSVFVVLSLADAADVEAGGPGVSGIDDCDAALRASRRGTMCFR